MVVFSSNDGVLTGLTRTARYRTVIQLMSDVCESFGETDGNYEFAAASQPIIIINQSMILSKNKDYLRVAFTQVSLK